MNYTSRTAILLIFALSSVPFWTASCADNDIPEEAFQNCAVLSAVQKNSDSSIAGNASIGPFDSYGIDASSSSSASVTPPADTPCAREIASRLQGLCAVCEQDGEAACQTATERIFDISVTPIEACAACGDNVCSPGESAVENDGDNTFCPQDCGNNCGDGTCSGIEQESCPDNAPAGTCIACPSDCNPTQCGDGACEGSEQVNDPNGENYCPQDCTPPCGDGICERGEQGNNPDDVLYCPQDCGAQGTCGDNRCQDTENAITCAGDCAECGDDICSEPAIGGAETLTTCAVDCDACGDGICGRSEVATEDEADPDNPNPLQRKRVCARDCE